MPVVPFDQRRQAQPSRPQVSEAEYLMAAATMEQLGILKSQEAIMEYGQHLGPSDEDIVKKLKPTERRA